MVFGCVDTVSCCRLSLSLEFGTGPLLREHPLTAIVVVSPRFASTVGFISERPSAAKQFPTVISDVSMLEDSLPTRAVVYNHFHPRIVPALQLQHPNSRHSDRGFLSGVPWFAASKHCSYWTLLRTIHLPDLRLDSRICMLFSSSLAIVGSLTEGFVSGVSWFAASKHCSYWTLPRTIHFLGRHLDSRNRCAASLISCLLCTLYLWSLYPILTTDNN